MASLLLVAALFGLVASGAAGQPLARTAPPAADPPRETRFSCGGEPFDLAVAGDSALMRLGGESIPLRRVPAAAGTHYQGTGTAGPVDLWEQDGAARVTIGQRQLPACVTAAAVQDALYRASGNEPAWTLSIRGDRAVLALGFERREISVALAPAGPAAGGVQRVSAPGQPPLRVVMAPGPCRDSMSGAGFPDRVTVEVEGRRLSGCGGTLASRLTGGPWTITEIGGRPAAGHAPVTLRFEEGGRMGGQGPCNTYGGTWRLEGEHLVVEQMATTMMACVEPASAQEAMLLRLLGSVRSWRIGEGGELVIEGEGGAVAARR